MRGFAEINTVGIGGGVFPQPPLPPPVPPPVDPLPLVFPVFELEPVFEADPVFVEIAVAS